MQVADILARTIKQISLVKQEVGHRQEVLAAIRALSEALADDEWLTQYESDPHKYKVNLLCLKNFFFGATTDEVVVLVPKQLAKLEVM